MNINQTTTTNNTTTPAEDFSLEIMRWTAEHYQEFNFAHAQANMLPDEFEDYRKGVIEEAVSFFQGLAQ